MNYKLKNDFSIGIRGRVVIEMINANGDVVDREFVLKHPFGLRFRLALALRRLRVRNRKMLKFAKVHGMMI